MKRIVCILLIFFPAFKLAAQIDTVKKRPTLVFHAFYNDFQTAQLIRTTSFGSVWSNHLWSRISDMQMGFGLGYMQGITKNLDFAANADGSPADYLFKNGTTYGSNRFLLDLNAGVNLKLLTDRHVIAPYLSAGAGFSLYQGKTGFYVPVGLGLQFNLFNQAFVFTSMQYRDALTAQVNDHFQYSA